MICQIIPNVAIVHVAQSIALSGDAQRRDDRIDFIKCIETGRFIAQIPFNNTIGDHSRLFELLCAAYEQRQMKTEDKWVKDKWVRT